MHSKRKSVTFREDVSTIYPKNFDGSSSPLPITTTPANAAQPPTLDPVYLNWLRVATKLHLPFIIDKTFATHLYRQNFEEHVKIKTYEQFERAEAREAAVSALATKYGSLGWGNLYREVSAQAWVKNYREIYRFNGSDEHLLEKMAEAYDEIKRAVAEEEVAYAQFTVTDSSSSSSSSSSSDPTARRWEPITQGAGALAKPDLGPGGVNVTFDNNHNHNHNNNQKDATDASSFNTGGGDNDGDRNGDGQAVQSAGVGMGAAAEGGGYDHPQQGGNEPGNGGGYGYGYGYETTMMMPYDDVGVEGTDSGNAAGWGVASAARSSDAARRGMVNAAFWRT